MDQGAQHSGRPALAYSDFGRLGVSFSHGLMTQEDKEGKNNVETQSSAQCLTAVLQELSGTSHDV